MATHEPKNGRDIPARKAGSSAALDPAHAPGKRHLKLPKGRGGRKTDLKIANLRVAQANRQRRPSNV